MLSDFDGAVLRLAIKIRGNDRPSCEDCATPDQFSPQSTSVARKNVIVAPFTIDRAVTITFLSLEFHRHIFQTLYIAYMPQYKLSVAISK